MTARFQVITRVPSGEDISGNLAAAFELYEDRQNGRRNNPTLVQGAFLTFRVPVFTYGEIVIVDSGGRELTGPQRKASKWDVDYETFDSVEEALDLAMKLLSV
jgi:hypothetical protein